MPEEARSKRITRKIDMNEVLYLDNAATTIPDDGCLTASFAELKNGGFYNPSALYRGGLSEKRKIGEIRKTLCSFFGNNYDAVFTSCGSEADNMAVFSFAVRGNAVTDSGEHSAIYNAFKELKNRGLETRFAALNKNGSVNVEKLLELIDEKTTFVSIVHVNNETGAINDVNDIAERVKKINPSIIFHVDGVQGFLKIPFKPNKHVDLYSVSAHKICALKGVGALVYRKGLHLRPLIIGGGQEDGLRSGTENTFGLSVFDKAMKKYCDVSGNFERIQLANARFKELMSSHVKFISDNNCSPYILSFSAEGVKAEIIQRVADDNGLILGTGSACSSKIGISRIITACGYDKKTAEGVLRASFIFSSDVKQAEDAADILIPIIENLRKALR